VPTAKSDNSKKRLILFCGMLLLGAVLMMVYSCLTGNTNQKFTDVVMEYTAMEGSNKSAERSLFYIFGIVGALLYTVVFLLKKWGATADAAEFKANKYVWMALAVSLVTNYFFYQKANWLVLSAIFISLIMTKKNEKLMIPAVSFLFISAYSICGIYRIYALPGIAGTISVKTISEIAFIITLVLALVAKDGKAYAKAVLVAQLFVPFTLLVFLMNTYQTVDKAYSQIRIPSRIKYLVILIIVAFLVEAIIRLVKGWKSASTLEEVLGFGTCVSIMNFNRFSGTGSIADLSLHHAFENVIGYSQIFELGQKPFEDYIPVSGMYSIVHGFFLAFFGHGRASYYNLTANLFYLSIIFVIVFLLRRQLKAEWVLFISLLFVVTDYNRITLIVPTILLLVWPKLIENKNMWLKAWFLTSLVHGLYYPVFGAAVCIGFLPLGIWQIYSYAKSGEFIKDVKTVKFWIWWIICFIPAVLSIKLLLGTLKHMLAMGSQTIFADGLTRFGQDAANGFLPFISSISLRLVVYYVLTYLILVAVIWFSVAMFLKLGQARFVDKKLLIDNPVSGFTALSIGIMFLIAFSYTVVRLDKGDLYSRSDGIVKAAFVLFVILVARYLKDKSKNALFVFGFAVFILSVVSAEGFYNMSSGVKLSSCYQVPKDDVYVMDDYSIRLGDCYINKDSYEYIAHINDYMNTLDRERGYFGLVDSFGLSYLCNIKGDSVMEIFNTLKGYGAVEETVDYLRRNDTIVGVNLDSDSNYYLYHWLVTSGDYVWSDENRLFFPNDGSVSREEILENNRTINLSKEDDELGRVAGSWGSSIETLENIFTEIDLGYTSTLEDNRIRLDFDRTIDGDEADFIYLEFPVDKSDVSYVLFEYNNEKTLENVEETPLLKKLAKQDYNTGKIVTVIWNDETGAEHRIHCNMDEGKLLIPLGAGRGWLLNRHSDIKIQMTEDNEIVVPLEPENIRFLKLREVE
jgi:hypothetical protein